MFLTRQSEKVLLERILRENLEQDYRRIFEASFTWKQFLYEMFVIGKSIIIAQRC